jgi:hypothetical protein
MLRVGTGETSMVEESSSVRLTSSLARMMGTERSSPR